MSPSINYGQIIRLISSQKLSYIWLIELVEQFVILLEHLRLLVYSYIICIIVTISENEEKDLK